MVQRRVIADLTKQYTALGVAHKDHSSDEEGSTISGTGSLVKPFHVAVDDAIGGEKKTHYRELFELHYDSEFGFPSTVEGVEKKGLFNSVRIRNEIAQMSEPEFSTTCYNVWKEQNKNVLAFFLEKSAKELGIVFKMPDQAKFEGAIKALSDNLWPVMMEMFSVPKEGTMKHHMQRVIECMLQRIVIDFIADMAWVPNEGTRSGEDWKKGQTSYTDYYSKYFGSHYDRGELSLPKTI
jgi:hypothetical protein